MSFITPNLKLPFIAPAQAQKHVTHNEAIRALDALVQLSLKSRALSSPPQVPEEGDRYYIAETASGSWQDKDGQITTFQDGSWAYFSPQIGWQTWIEDESVLQVWDGQAWHPVGADIDTQNLNFVGINAQADTINKLALSSSASLFNHDGAGHQLKLNKNSASDTAAVLYQTGFSGRSEVGLTGDDDFHFKVSPDGSTFHNGIIIDKDTGNVSLGDVKDLSGKVTIHATNTPSFKLISDTEDEILIGMYDAQSPSLEHFELSYNCFTNLGKIRVNGSDRITFANVGGSTNINGNLSVSRNNPSLIVEDTGGVGNAHSGIVSFRDGAGSEKVWMGLGSNGTSRFSFLTHYSDGIEFITYGNNAPISFAQGGGTRFRINSGGASTESLIPFKVPTYSVGAQPSAITSGAGAIVYINNEAGGAVLAFSDGVNWRRTTDRAIVT